MTTFLVRIHGFILTTIVVSQFGCSFDSVQCSVEKIQPPLGLEYKPAGSPYAYAAIEFFAENKESNFIGYSIFTGSSADEAKNKAMDNGIAQVKEEYLCSVGSIVPQYDEVTVLALSGTPQTGHLQCRNPDNQTLLLNLPSGTYVAIRAKSTRSEIPAACGAVDLYSPASVLVIP